MRYMKSKKYIIKYITKSAGQTRKIGEKLAREILFARRNNKISRKEKSMSPTTTLNQGEWWGRGFPEQRKRALVLAMEGDLGGGKTTFVQGFAKGLGIKENITSPTFVILKKFKIPSFAKATASKAKSKFQFFYHIDAYRLEKPKDLLDLGFEKILSGWNNIIAVEWSEKIQKILPKNVIKIRFEFVDENTRKIRINF